MTTQIIYVVQHNNYYGPARTFEQVLELCDIEYTFEQYNQDRQLCSQDDEEYWGAESDLPNGDRINIIELPFDAGEPVSYMKCSGPDLECCFVNKKTKAQFWVEALGYMKANIEQMPEEDDSVSIVEESLSNYDRIVVSLVDEDNEETDMMTFEFVYNIRN